MEKKDDRFVVSDKAPVKKLKVVDGKFVFAEPKKEEKKG